MKKKSSMYIKFAIDIVMAITFVLFFNKHVLGGLAFHEIAGFLIAGVFFTHVLLNWKWVKNITVKLFDRKLPRKTKVGYFLNLVLLITMSFIIISGIFISKVVFPDIDISNQRWFQISHISISFIVLILVAAHVGLHWQWVINVIKNLFSSKPPKRIVGIIAKVAMVALLVFGCYQMFSTNFFMQLGRAASILTFSSASIPEGGFNGGERQFEGSDFPEGDFERDYRGGRGQFEKRDFYGAEFERGTGQFESSDIHYGDFEGRGRGDHFESANALGVIITYFSIMSVFIIITFYSDKWIRTNKRKKNEMKFSEVNKQTV